MKPRFDNQTLKIEVKGNRKLFSAFTRRRTTRQRRKLRSGIADDEKLLPNASAEKDGQDIR